jgi:hypothetical protein
LLPKTARLQIGGLEDDAEAGADRGRESSAARQRRRYASMWDGARDLFSQVLGQPDPKQAELLRSPQTPSSLPRNHFNAESCLRLLEVLPESARNAESLRASAMRRLAQMLNEDDDQRARPTVRRRRAVPLSSSSENGSEYSSFDE